MNRDSSARSGAGASSVMVIIMIVSLTVFAVLAIVSVRSENNLTQKTTQTFAARYEADAGAQRTIALVDQAIYRSTAETLRQNVEAVPGVSLSEDGASIHFIQAVTEDISLVVELGNIAPGAEQSRYTVLVYQQIKSEK